MSDDEPEGEPAVTVRGRRLGDHAIMNLELLAGLFGLGRTLLDNASEAVKTLLHSRFRIPFEALEWGTETVSADVLAAATGIGESELAQRVTAEALALADRVAITVQAFLEGKQLLGEVEVTHSGWHRGDDDVMREVKGTYKGKRVRVARFVDSAGNAKLETVTVDGEARELLAFDVLLAEFFAELGTPEAKATAAKIRKTPPEERGKRWKAATTPDGGPLGPRACLAVFQAVWAKLKDERADAAKEAERAREDAKHNRPALPRVVLVDQLFPAMTKQLQLLDDGKVRTDKGRILGAIVVDADTTLAVVRAGAALLGSEPGHEMIHELVHRAFDAHEAGASDPRRVGFIGGWGALAEAIGYGKGDHSILKLIAKAGQAIEWQTRHIGAGGLWTWTDKRGSRHGGAGEVAFVLGDALLPGLAAAMKREPLARTLSAREARRLVVEPRYKPPTSGVRPNERGAVWTLWRLFMLELTDKSVEYCGKGSIAVTVPRWRELHEQARLPWATHEKVLASWLEGESAKAPAFLAELEPGRFDLAPVHDLERVFLAEQGRRRLESATEGAKGPRAKASKKRK